VSNAGIRKIISRVAEAFCLLAVILALIPLALILFYVVTHGLTALNLAFFTHTPKPVGEPGGGMANAIVGTLVLIALAGAFAVPIGCMCGVHLSEYPSSKFSGFARFAADVLNGVPSIVIGIFAYTIAVLPIKRFSAIAGGVALGILMLPIVVRTTEELLRLVPPGLREGALALGASRSRAVMTVILPAALPGILTGVLVALARVAGETAPLLFTSSIVGTSTSWNPTQALQSVPVAIFELSESASPDDHARAWAAALVLLLFILFTSLTARWLANRSRRKIARAG
jgi:phosphate transport system permease protein